MLMDIIGIDLFDQNMSMGCARLVWGVLDSDLIFMDITDIDLFDQIVGMVCAKVRLRC